jgi:hypothetical protein
MSIQTVNPQNNAVKSFEEMTEKTVDAKVARPIWLILTGRNELPATG